MPLPGSAPSCGTPVSSSLLSAPTFTPWALLPGQPRPHGPSSILEAVLTPGLRFPHLIEFFSANFAHVAAWFWKALPPQPGALMPEAKSLATGHQRSWEKPEGPAGPASGWEGVLSLPSPLPGVRGLRLLVDNLHVTRRAQLSC